MKQHTTIVDIAVELNLSAATVSRALRKDRYNVSKETMQKVLETARRMGYIRDESAANLRQMRSRKIGIIVPESANYFFATFNNHVQEYLEKEGYMVSSEQCYENADLERVNLRKMMDSKVEGIILCACHNSKNMDVYKELLDMGIPLVFFDRTVDDIPVSKVKIDDYLKAFFMVEHLIRQGKRRIIHLAGPSYIQNTHERVMLLRANAA